MGKYFVVYFCLNLPYPQNIQWLLRGTHEEKTLDMKTQIAEIVERFQDGLEQLTRSRERLQLILKQMFTALEQKKIRVNIDVNGILMALYESEGHVKDSGRILISQLEQSFELARISALISSTLNLYQVVEEVMDTIVYLTKADRAYLMLRDPLTDEMTIVSARNWEKENLTEDAIVFSHSIIDMAIEKREPVISADATADGRFDSATSIISNKLRSVMCLPLIFREKIIGVLYADNLAQRGLFQPDNLPIITAFAQ